MTQHDRKSRVSRRRCRLPKRRSKLPQARRSRLQALSEFAVPAAVLAIVMALIAPHAAASCWIC